MSLAAYASETNYVVIVVAGYWATQELCKNINFAMETKAKELNCRHIQELNRLSLGQISEFLRLRKESYCNVKLKWPDTGQHTLYCSVTGVNIVNNEYLRCSGPFIFLLCITLVFCAEMAFSANCACSHHNTWHHGDVSPDSLLIATAEELRFCNVDRTKNRNRKRTICLACQGRIAREIVR